MMMSRAGLAAMLARMESYDIYRLAVDLFEDRDYYSAARALEHLIEAHPHDSELGEARELLARSYFHSAQTARSIEVARDLLDREPSNAYAALLLSRSLERKSQHDEAQSVRRLAAALGQAA